MRSTFTSTVIASTLLLLPSVFGHNIQLNPHARECFHEDLRKDDRMTVSFQVGDREFGSAGNLDVDFWIQKPNGAMVVNEPHTSMGDHSFTADVDGKFTYCFSNEGSHLSSKEVSFNVHGVVYVNEDEHPGDPLEKEVRWLTELLNQVKDEQEYTVIRERVHRNTAESTNSRIKWWSVFQLGVLVGNCIFQVYYLRRFFEVKRIV